VTIGACQTPGVLGGVDAAVARIRGFREQAEPESADRLLLAGCWSAGLIAVATVAVPLLAVLLADSASRLAPGRIAVVIA